MSHHATPLLNHMYTRFREVFGTPNTMLELDSQWTLRPDSQAALSQILFNLISNAQHAILSRGTRGRITISARAGPTDRLELRVEDDGPGMPPDVRTRCMDPYFTTKANSFGTGLGLALVQSLMAGVGGTVEIHSPPSGKPAGAGGTEILLTLHRASLASPESGAAAREPKHTGVKQ